MELVHDDLDAYREFLAVVHLVKPPSGADETRDRRPRLGKWARTRLSGQKTLIARNYENRTVPQPSPEPPDARSRRRGGDEPQS